MSNLSNTATPIYYEQFRESVLRGDIPVCREISMEMNRIDYRILNPDIFYDPRPVEGFINYCEAEMTKTDGSDIKLLDSFKLWAEQLFGWFYYAVKNVYDSKQGGFVEVVYLKRLISKQYLIVARGGAKSMYASFVQSYFLVTNVSTTHQITTAPTMRQADEVLAPIRTAMIRTPGPLLKFMVTPRKSTWVHNNKGSLLQASKKGIENFLTGSRLEVRPMTIAKLQSLRPYVTTVDEWLSADVREDVMGAIEQGASKLDEYIIVATSSEGTIRNGSGDDIKLELMKILSGEYDDPHTSIFHYKLDDVSQIADPTLWVMAQPNIGITVSYESYERDVKRAENTPSSSHDIIAKRFNIPMEGYTYFFTYAETIPHKKTSFTGMACALGGDLSQGDDFCAFTFLFPMRRSLFGVKTICFITEKKLKSLNPSARIKYNEFIEEGSLYVLNGHILNTIEVFEVLAEIMAERQWEVLSFGYDPYNAESFVKMYKSIFGSHGVELVRQGSRTESVPLGEIKILAGDRALVFDQKIMQFAMGNTMVLEDTNGNRKLYKRRYEDKIDPVSGLMDAVVSYNRNLDMFL